MSSAASVNGALQRRHSVASSAFESPQLGQLIAMLMVPGVLIASELHECTGRPAGGSIARLSRG